MGDTGTAKIYVMLPIISGTVWPKTRPGPVKPGQHSLITGPAGLGWQISRCGLKYGPARPVAT